MRIVIGCFFLKIMMPVLATLTVAGLALFATTGCTPTMNFYSNGYPLAKEANFSSSADGKLYSKWVLVRWYPKKIERPDFTEFVDYPEYLSIDDLNTLRGDTRAVVLNIQISNPQLRKYRLVKVVKIDGIRQKEEVSDWTIRSDNNLIIAGPLIFDKEVTISLSIPLDQHSSLISIPRIQTSGTTT